MSSKTRSAKSKSKKSTTTSSSSIPHFNEEIVPMDALDDNVSDTTPTDSPASKRVKPVFDIISETLTDRFFDNHIGTRPIASVGKQNSALPFGCLITRIFQSFKVNTTGFEVIAVKDHIDAKNLTQSNLRAANGKIEHIVEPSQPTDDVTIDTHTPASPKFVQLVERIASDTATIVENHNALVTKISALEGEIGVLKTMVSMLIGKEAPITTPSSKQTVAQATTSSHQTPLAAVPPSKNAPGDENAKKDYEIEDSLEVDVDV